MDEQLKTMGGGCLGGVLGAVLGIVLGGFIGPVIATSGNDLRKNPDPFAKQISGMMDGCMGFIGMVLGAGIGGIVGGVGGSVLGAGLATRVSRTPPGSAEPPREAGPGGVPEVPGESANAELARLKERVAELEQQGREKGASPDA